VKIVVIGSNGQLGQDVCRLSPDAIALTRTNGGDLINGLALRKTLEDIRPRIVVNCGAYTAVDRAEHDVARAFTVNAIGVRDLAITCRDLDATLIHISTNYVFGGGQTVPYDERDLTGPVNVYGASKLVGEGFAAICPKHYILRTCGLYGHGSKANFVETVIRKAIESQGLWLVNDQFCTPTSTVDLARGISRIIYNGGTHGLYHVTNTGNCSWYDFAREVFVNLGWAISIDRVKTGEYKTAAARPLYTVLNCEKWYKEFGNLMEWRDALREYMDGRKL
jgi:dTDP-4-dehydrorhamnose reductase